MSDSELAVSYEMDWNKEFGPALGHIYVYPTCGQFGMVVTLPGGYPNDFGPSEIGSLRVSLEARALAVCQYVECREPPRKLR